MNFKVTTIICMMMMMMMTEAAAMPKPGNQSKHLMKTHKKTVETVPLLLDPNALVLTRSIRALENVSISPWTYNISTDTSLFPPLSEAQCLLHGCLDSEGREDRSLESKPIMRQVLQLRKVSLTEGTGSGAAQSYYFRLESRLIAVGCTCIRPVVWHQQ